MASSSKNFHASGLSAISSKETFRVSRILETLPKVLGKVAPDAVDVGAAVARVVMFHQEGGTLQTVIMRMLRFEAVPPRRR